MVSRQALWRKRWSGDPVYRAKRRAQLRAYRAAHRDKINARRRAKYRAQPGHHIERRYGISRGEYRALLESQGGVCAICGQTCRRRLAVDHCHSSGKVRGLLCSKCNAGLGMYGDDTDRMRAAIAYLERSRRKQPSGSGPGDDTGDAEAGRRFSAEPLAATPPPRATTDGRHPGSRGLATARPE